MQGRNIMKGRHSVGVQRVNTGKTRAGQSEPASNKVKTSSTAFYSKKQPYVPDAKDTSTDEQNFIKEAPSPFKNKMQTGSMGVPQSPAGAKSGLEPKIRAGLSGSTVGAKANPPGRSVGYKTLPNQSGQIGGRMGFPPPKRKAGVNGSGFPSKRNASFYGE